MPPYVIIIIVVVLILGLLVFPFFNKLQFNRLPEEQKVRILIKQAKGLVYFKNVTNGQSGTLYFVKNKRKIYTFPWVLKEGSMLCTRDDLLKKWDYPEEHPEFTEEEITQVLSELENYNKKNIVKIYLDYDA